MTNKEWLKNITPKDLDLSGNVMLMLDGSVLMLFEDYCWLIKQAKRVQELEQQNKLYRESLEFYADRENYEPEHYDPDTHDYTSMIDHDKGATARKAKALEVEE